MGVGRGRGVQSPPPTSIRRARGAWCNAVRERCGSASRLGWMPASGSASSPPLGAARLVRHRSSWHRIESHSVLALVVFVTVRSGNPCMCVRARACVRDRERAFVRRAYVARRALLGKLHFFF